MIPAGKLDNLLVNDSKVFILFTTGNLGMGPGMLISHNEL